MTEQWKQIPNYPYEVSTFGRLRNSRYDIVKPGVTKLAGLQYRLYNIANIAVPTQIYVPATRLIAGMWIEYLDGNDLLYPYFKPSQPWVFPSFLHIKHHDRDWKNNHIENLYIKR